MRGRLHHDLAAGLLPRDDWVADHADWHPRIQGSKSIDVSRDDGERVLAKCLERAARLWPEA